jgi:ligand-binding sensor domain-containing protein
MKIYLTNNKIIAVKINVNLLFFNIFCLLLSVILFPYCCLQSQSQGLAFEHLSVDQGMPTVVNYILQDKIGYLWFATNSGLYKYDGYSFTLTNMILMTLTAW